MRFAPRRRSRFLRARTRPDFFADGWDVGEAEPPRTEAGDGVADIAVDKRRAGEVGTGRGHRFERVDRIKREGGRTDEAHEFAHPLERLDAGGLIDEIGPLDGARPPRVAGQREKGHERPHRAENDARAGQVDSLLPAGGRRGDKVRAKGHHLGRGVDRQRPLPAVRCVARPRRSDAGVGQRPPLDIALNLRKRPQAILASACLTCGRATRPSPRRAIQPRPTRLHPCADVGGECAGGL